MSVAKTAEPIKLPLGEQTRAGRRNRVLDEVKYTDIAVRSLTWHTATETRMPCRITQCYLPPGRGDIPALTPAEAGTRLSDPGEMQGWVDPVGWLHTEMVYPPRPKTVTHPSTNRARRALTSFMRRTPPTTTPRRQPDPPTGKGTLETVMLTRPPVSWPRPRPQLPRPRRRPSRPSVLMRHKPDPRTR